jgi:tetratricopeptide (TPR) repeat protein
MFYPFNMAAILKASFLLISLMSMSISVQSNDDAAQDIATLDSLFQQQDYKEVVSRIQQMPKESLSEEHYRLLVYSLADDDLDDAEQAAEQGLQQFPNAPDLFLIHASIMGQQASNSVFSALGYAEKAIDSLETAVRLAPNDIKYRIALVSFHLNAPSIAGGDKEEAFKQIKIIQQLDAISGVVYLAWYHQVMDNPQAALEVLQQANEDYPKNISILNALASYAVRASEYAQAILYYQAITQIKLQRPIHDLSVLEEYDESLYSQLNAHYQIGRAALVGKTNLAEGIMHLQIYIDNFQNPETLGVLDTSGLPSIEWAKLRMAGLLLADAQKAKAQALFATITLDKSDENMQKVYSALKKDIK